MTSVLFVYVVFYFILHILIIHYQDDVCVQYLLVGWFEYMPHDR